MTALKLLESYLTNRTRFIEFNGVLSSKLQISTGVPQGSILGPLLFLIYINDIPQASTQFNFIMYADDITLFSTFKTSTKEGGSCGLVVKVLDSKIKGCEFKTLFVFEA